MPTKVLPTHVTSDSKSAEPPSRSSGSSSRSSSSSFGALTAAAAEAAKVGANYCEHTGFDYCHKCATVKQMVGRKRSRAKEKLHSLHVVGAFVSAKPDRKVSREDSAGDSDASSDDDDEPSPSSNSLPTSDPSQLECGDESDFVHRTKCEVCCRRYTNLVRAATSGT